MTSILRRPLLPAAAGWRRLLTAAFFGSTVDVHDATDIYVDVTGDCQYFTAATATATVSVHWLLYLCRMFWLPEPFYSVHYKAFCVQPI